ncbi:hypothetical protein [Flammeovirga aprica]|uniref:Secretion system C-terminal sorting domain-containing protein n=1 Tax=Flammeovirga aprica JL-4 TaxID=694437 RepID=A0A7X9S0R5_9BACT|nr:hypothetical protein [Flammeovirga aprica]NME72248.1 hypothetical protein [Flammeovirga aprica JL-4]
MKPILYLLVCSMFIAGAYAQQTDQDTFENTSPDQHLKGSVNGKEVMLTFENTFSMEEGRLYIQGSDNNKEWYKKTEIENANSVHANVAIRFMDHFPSKYYRIIKVEEDGFTEVVSTLNLSMESYLEVLLYTAENQNNPIKLSLKTDSSNSKIQFSIYDKQGYSVYNTNIQTAKGERVIQSFYLSEILKKGSYWVELKQEKRKDVNLINVM